MPPPGFAVILSPARTVPKQREAALGKWMVRAALLLLLATVVNDGGRYLAALYRIDDVTRNMAFAAAVMAKGRPGADTGWPAVATLAQDSGVEVTGYRQTGNTVVVTTRAQVPGTWLAGPILAWVTHQPTQAPLTITQEASSKS